MRRFFCFQVLLLLFLSFFSCTLYRPPDAVIQDKSRALDLYLFAGNTDSPDYYDAALAYAIIPAAYFEKGELFIRKGEWEQARQNYDTALHYSRNYGMAASRMEYLEYLKRQERIKPVDILRESKQSEEEPASTEDPVEPKEEYLPEDSIQEEYEPLMPLREEDFPEAEPSFKIVTTSPFPFREEPVVSTGVFKNPIKGVDFHLDKARLFYQHRLYEEAIEELKIIIEMLDYRESSEPYLILLKIHQAHKDERKALNVIKQMHTIFPEDEEMYFQTALFFIERGNFQQAIESLSSAINLNPADPRYYNNLAICYRKKGKINEAHAAYKQAIELDPDFTDAYLNLGILYETVLLDADKALEQYEQYIKLDGHRSNEVQKWVDKLKENR